VYMLTRCKEAEAVYRKYSYFLREIQDEVARAHARARTHTRRHARTQVALATEMMDRAEDLHARANSHDSKSQASTSRNSTDPNAHMLLRPVAARTDAQNGFFAIQLRIATGILLCVVIALMVGASPPRKRPPSRDAHRAHGRGPSVRLRLWEATSSSALGFFYEDYHTNTIIITGTLLYSSFTLC
jgi:hypothetical protein